MLIVVIEKESHTLWKLDHHPADDVLMSHIVNKWTLLCLCHICVLQLYNRVKKVNKNRESCFAVF